jgi:hypothetical protein
MKKRPHKFNFQSVSVHNKNFSCKGFNSFFGYKFDQYQDADKIFSLCENF